jgi:hypothetical protein
MGQTISINKNNIHKTHRFTDKMYITLSLLVDRNYANNYEKQFINTMKPVYENNSTISIFNCTYISNGYCIVARRLNKSRLIEAKAIAYTHKKRYNNFTKGYAKFVQTNF